jgi:hypothetical protein
MSPRATRWLLWLAALAALPVPIFGVGSGRVPPLHHLELGALALAFTALERAQGIGPLLSGIFIGQALAWGLALWLAAALLARLLSRLPPLVRTRATVLLIVLGLALAAAQPIYRTPYSAHAARSTLLGTYR